MTGPDLLLVCGAAFLAVLVLLSLLAGVIQGLSVVFPPGPGEIVGGIGTSGGGGAGDGGDAGPVDPAVVAAISTAVAGTHPHLRVTRIEEQR